MHINGPTLIRFGKRNFGHRLADKDEAQVSKQLIHFFKYQFSKTILAFLVFGCLREQGNIRSLMFFLKAGSASGNRIPHQEEEETDKCSTNF
jgi:hypothetical protein